MRVIIRKSQTESGVTDDHEWIGEGTTDHQPIYRDDAGRVMDLLYRNLPERTWEELRDLMNESYTWMTARELPKGTRVKFTKIYKDDEFVIVEDLDEPVGHQKKLLRVGDNTVMKNDGRQWRWRYEITKGSREEEKSPPTPMAEKAPISELPEGTRVKFTDNLRDEFMVIWDPDKHKKRLMRLHDCVILPNVDWPKRRDYEIVGQGKQT